MGQTFTERLLALKPTGQSVTSFLGSLGIGHTILNSWRRSESRDGIPGINLRTVIRLADRLQVPPAWLALGPTHAQLFPGVHEESKTINGLQ